MHKTLIAPALITTAVIGLVTLSGCAKPQPTSEKPGAAPSSASQQPSSQKPGSAQPSSQAPASQSAPGSPQGTADAVAETFLHAVGEGNAQQACDVMAIQGRPVNEAGIGEACTQMLTPTLGRAQKAGSFAKATVSGAKVTGEEASYAEAQVTPEDVKSMLSSFKAVKIDNKWYLTS